MRTKTEDILFQKERLKAAMQDLLDSLVVHGDDGICISDVEFSLNDFYGVLGDFEKSLSNPTGAFHDLHP